MSEQLKVKAKFLLDIRITVGVAAVAILAYLGDFIEADLLNFILGLVGINGLAGVRQLIDTAGGKTYILAGSGAVLTAAFFLAGQFGFLDAEAVQEFCKVVLGVTFGAASYTLHSALGKKK